MSTGTEWVEQFAEFVAAIEAHKELMTGDELTDVTVDGETRPSFQKYIKSLTDDNYNLLRALISGRLTYANKAEMDAVTPTIPAGQTTVSAEVLNDETAINNGLYVWDVSGAKWVKTPYSSFDMLSADLADLGIIVSGNTADIAAQQLEIDALNGAVVVSPTVSGTSDTIIATSGFSLSSNPKSIILTPTDSNISDSTINIDGIGETDILSADGSALGLYSLQAGHSVLLVLDSSGSYRLATGDVDALKNRVTVLENQSTQAAIDAAEDAQEYRDAAAASAISAGISASDAASDAADTLSAKGASLTAADTAVAAAESSGNVLFCDTKADATAALSGLSENQIVEVFVDESQNNKRTRYRVESNALVFKITLGYRRAIYLDNLNGSDLNSGLSPDDAVATVGAAQSLLSDGDEFFVARNCVFYDGDFGDFRHLTVRPFGSGRRPIFTAALEIPAASWANYSGNIYKATVTHNNSTSGSTDPAFYCQFALWDDYKDSYLKASICGLERIANDSADVDLATEIASLTAGSFTVRRTGAPDQRPYTVAATSFDYYVWLADDADPSVLTDRVIRYGEIISTASFGYGCDIEGFDFCRSSGKDHVSGGSDLYGSVGRVHDVRLIDAAVHGSVMRGSTYTKIYAEKNPYASFGGAGNAVHLYRWTANDGKSRGAWADEIEAYGFVSTIYCHDEGDTTTEAFSQWDLGTIKSRNCSLAVSTFEVDSGVNIKKLIVENDLGFGRYIGASGQRGLLGDNGGGEKVVIDEYIFRAAPYDPTVNDLRNSVTVIRANAEIKTGYIYIPSYPQDVFLNNSVFNGTLCSYDADNLTIVTDNVHPSQPKLFGTTYAVGTNLTIQNSIVDIDISLTTAGSVNASNCYLRWGEKTLADMQAIYSGIDDTCYTHIVDQVYDYTFTSSDIDLNTAAGWGDASTTSGDPYFLATAASLANYGQIIIVGGGSGGVDLTVVLPVRDSGNDSGGLYAYTCSNISSFPETVSGVDIYIPYSNNSIFPLTQGSARLNRDTDSIVCDNIAGMITGQLVYLTGFGRREDFGVFEIDSVSGDIVTLTEDIPWRYSSTSSASLYPLSTDASDKHAPFIDVQYGFPIPLSNSGDEMSATITYASSETLDFNADRSSATGLMEPKASSLSAVLNAETGEITSGLIVNVGDNVSLTTKIIVDSYIPKYSTNPTRTIAALDYDSRYAVKAMGYTSK